MDLKKIICAPEEHFRRYVYALRFAIGLLGTQTFHPIVKYKHYQISSRARAVLYRHIEPAINVERYTYTHYYSCQLILTSIAVVTC